VLTRYKESPPLPNPNAELNDSRALCNSVGTYVINDPLQNYAIKQSIFSEKNIPKDKGFTQMDPEQAQSHEHKLQRLAWPDTHQVH
jgi:hypothetical protein